MCVTDAKYFPFLPQVPPQAGQPIKFTVLESCDRIKQEFDYLQQQNNT